MVLNRCKLCCLVGLLSLFFLGQVWIVSAEEPTTGSLVITKAVYGNFGRAQQVDVTKKVAGMIQGGYLRVRATNDIFGDPAFSYPKKFRVNYVLNGKSDSITLDEEQTLTLGTKPVDPSRKLFVTKALYGKLPNGEKIDVTRRLDDWVENDRLCLEVSDTNFGQFKTKIEHKQMQVEYQLDGVKKTKTVGEGQMLEIPEDAGK